MVEHWNYGPDTEPASDEVVASLARQCHGKRPGLTVIILVEEARSIIERIAALEECNRQAWMARQKRGSDVPQP